MTRREENTAVLFGSNLGNANAHDSHDLPILLAGGTFKHGRYAAHDKHKNLPLCDLFVSMLQKTGIETGSFADSTSTLRW